MAHGRGLGRGQAHDDGAIGFEALVLPGDDGGLAHLELGGQQLQAALQQVVRGRRLREAAEGDAPARQAARNHAVGLQRPAGGAGLGGELLRRRRTIGILHLADGQRCGGPRALGGEAFVEQHAHAAEALVAGEAAQQHADHPLAVAQRRGDEVVARAAGEAGLQPVGTGIEIEDGIDAGQIAAEVGHAMGGKVVIVLGKIVEQRQGQHGHVVGRRRLLRIRQARRVAEIAAGHAQALRGRRHAAGKARLIAPDPFGQHHGGVVGRARDGGEDGVLDADLLALGEAELGWRHGRGIGRDGEDVAQLEAARRHLLEGEVERHQLGEGGRPPEGRRLARGENLARCRIDDDGGLLGRQRRRGTEKKEGHQPQSARRWKAPEPAPHALECNRQERRESWPRRPLPAFSIGRQFLVRLGNLGLHGRTFMGPRRRSRY